MSLKIAALDGNFTALHDLYASGYTAVFTFAFCAHAGYRGVADFCFGMISKQSA